MKLPNYSTGDGRKNLDFSLFTHNSADEPVFNPKNGVGVPKELQSTGRKKASKVMKEYHAGTLYHGGSGKVVTRPDVAKAIAMSEGRAAEKTARKRKS